MPDSLVVDVHTHGPHFVPQPFRGLYRLINRRTMPAEVGFDALRAAGVDAVVGKAVGDPVVTRWYRGPAWSAVVAQLRQLEGEIRSAGGDVVVDSAGMRRSHAEGRPALVLGVEGLDAAGEDLARIDDLYALGVRVVVPVHLGDNQIGTTALPWQRYLGPIPVLRRPRPGLTPFGHAVIERMNQLGIVVDVSHADHATTLDIVGASRQPVIASHSGSRACHDFARYLHDDEAVAIAGTGGVIGLWPYFHRGHGLASVSALVGQVRHLAELIGPEHLCIGTDMNGVPGLMPGYRGEMDFPVLTSALSEAGLADADIRAVLGGNFLRVVDAVAGTAWDDGSAMRR
jgi:microsomal dipeptidase-like Zn-dependent dipeptidase